MGVKNLWQALLPAKETINLHTLEGATLCVDLSAWLFEANRQKHIPDAYTHPHLFVVYSRAMTLMRLGIRLVIVVEGTSPSVLKKNTLKKRYGVNVREGIGMNAWELFGYTSKFTTWCRESIDLLEGMGIPCIR
eukprot:Ihof_evm2s613 gene=Ihof_evmTU2s613